MSESATIVACATAPGRGLRALVRLSGEDAVAIVRALSPLDPSCRIQATRMHLPAGSLPCIAIVARAPRSYTGEDSVELLVPANDDLVACVEARLLDVAAAVGATCRRAAPGEFTLRAFTHGRIDLTQAEGIAATIAATNDAQLRAARQLAAGDLARFVGGLADRIADDLALVEAGIDFTDEEDVVAISPSDLRDHVGAARRAIDDRLDHSTPIERLEAAPRVVLAGPVNAGKSTLFNALLGRKRAVESPTAGTTRDVLDEPLTLRTPTGAISLRLCDVAGIDEGATGLNPVMQERVRDAIARADLVVRCEPADIQGVVEAPGELLVRTKSDLAPGAGLRVSATTGAGLERLQGEIAARLVARMGSAEGESLALAARHAEALVSASAALAECQTLLEARRRHEVELIAASLRAALDALGAINGRIAPDDVLGRIFGRFCIGK